MLRDATLLKQQKNTLLQILVGAGFDPADFEWHEFVTTDSNSTSWMANGPLEFKVSKLVHRSSEYFIIFGGLNIIYSPGTTRKEEREEHHDDWQRRYQSFRAWLSCLKKEVEAPDLWAAVRQERALSDAGSSSLENTSFAPSELTQIAGQLSELKQHVLAGQQLQTEQAEFIEGQFVYLKEASERNGRKDWLNIALATFVTIIVAGAFAPDQAKTLLGMAGILFKWVWSGASTLLP